MHYTSHEELLKDNQYVTLVQNIEPMTEEEASANELSGLIADYEYYRADIYTSSDESMTKDRIVLRLIKGQDGDYTRDLFDQDLPYYIFFGTGPSDNVGPLNPDQTLLGVDQDLKIYSPRLDFWDQSTLTPEMESLVGSRVYQRILELTRPHNSSNRNVWIRIE